MLLLEITLIVLGTRGKSNKFITKELNNFYLLKASYSYNFRGLNSYKDIDKREAYYYFNITIDKDNYFIFNIRRRYKLTIKATYLIIVISLKNVPLIVARCFANATSYSPSVTRDDPTLPPKPTSAKQARHYRFGKQ